jgi:hypothetical protein
MAFGGVETQRESGFAKVVATIFESLGVLNKGSAQAAAAPSASETSVVQPISSNALNVTRVGGVGALIAAAGVAALAIFNVKKDEDPHSIVVAAYASVGLIVASALIAVAVILAADIRARASIATATAPPTAQTPAEIKSVRGSGETKLTLDRAYSYVLVDAGSGPVSLELPDPASCAWQCIRVQRTDDNGNNYVRIDPLAAAYATLKPDRRIRLYSDGKAWTRL